MSLAFLALTADRKDGMRSTCTTRHRTPRHHQHGLIWIVTRWQRRGWPEREDACIMVLERG